MQYHNFGHFLVDSLLSGESNNKYGSKKLKYKFLIESK